MLLQRRDLKILVAALWADMAAAQTVFIQPAYVDTLARYGGLGPERAGYALSWEMTAFAVTTIAMAFFAHRLPWKPTIWAALLVIASGNVLSMLLADFQQLLIVRTLVGGASGLIVPLAFAAVGRLANPERAFGLMIGILLIYAALFLGIMPWLTSVAGVTGLFGGMLFTCIIAAFGMRWFPDDCRPEEAGARNKFTWPAKGHRLALAGMLLYFAHLTSFWSFASVVAEDNRVSEGSIALALATSQIAGIVGTALPAVWGDRIPLIRALALAVLGSVASVAILLVLTDASTFLLAVLLFHFGWNLGHSYLLALFARLDPTSNLIVMATAMQKVGIAAGPAIAAAIYGVKGGNWVMIASLLLGLAAMAALTPAARLRKVVREPDYNIS
ncbi:AraJ Arabinose efflux permease [Sphingomonadaceae bacterium]